MWGIIRFLYNYMIYGLINHVNVGNVTYLRECRSLIYRPENYRSNTPNTFNISNESDNDDIIIEDVGEPIVKTSTIYSMNMMFMGKMYKILIPSNPLITDDNDVIVYVERDKFDTIIGIKDDNEEELTWISEYRGPNGNFYSNVVHPKMFGYDSFKFEDFDEEYMTVSTNFIVIN